MCSVGDPVTTRCECKHRKYETSATQACFQARPSLTVAGSNRNQEYTPRADKPTKGVGGERRAKLIIPGLAHASICPDQCAYGTNNVRT